MIYGTTICSLCQDCTTCYVILMSLRLCVAVSCCLRNQEIWGSYVFLSDGENNTTNLK